MTCPEDLAGRFDLALITIGVLNWMPDLTRFLSVVSSLLDSGGRLVVYETHPVLDMFDTHTDTPYLPVYSYFRTEPFISDDEIVYDGSAHRQGAAFLLVFPHHGRHRHRLREGWVADFGTGGIPALQPRNRDYDIYENQHAQLPMCYTLTATRT